MDQESRFPRLGRGDACLSSTFFDAAANLMLSLGPSDAGISEQRDSFSTRARMTGAERDFCR